VTDAIRCERCGLEQAENMHEAGDVLIVSDDCGHEEDSCFGCLADRRALGERVHVLAGGRDWVYPSASGRLVPVTGRPASSQRPPVRHRGVHGGVDARAPRLVAPYSDVTAVRVPNEAER